MFFYHVFNEKSLFKVVFSLSGHFLFHIFQLYLTSPVLSLPVAKWVHAQFNDFVCVDFIFLRYCGSTGLCCIFLISTFEKNILFLQSSLNQSSFFDIFFLIDETFCMECVLRCVTWGVRRSYLSSCRWSVVKHPAGEGVRTKKTALRQN